MTPGTVLLHTKFPFRDQAEPGRKLCIVLNDGIVGYYILVKTTSKSYFYSSSYGCQPPPARHPAFFLPQTMGTFPKDTWIQLDDFFRFDLNYLVQKGMDGVILPKFRLPNIFLMAILDCALLSEDLSLGDFSILRQTLADLRSFPV